MFVKINTIIVTGFDKSVRVTVFNLEDGDQNEQKTINVNINYIR